MCYEFSYNDCVIIFIWFNVKHYNVYSAKNRSASIAAIQPEPAAVIA